VTEYQKSAKRRTPRQLEIESLFVSDFDNIFDIAHKDALTLINIKEDRVSSFSKRERKAWKYGLNRH